MFNLIAIRLGCLRFIQRFGFLLLNYAVFGFIVPELFIALKKVFHILAATQGNFSFALLKIKLLVFGAINLNNSEIRQQTTETMF